MSNANTANITDEPEQTISADVPKDFKPDPPIIATVTGKELLNYLFEKYKKAYLLVPQIKKYCKDANFLAAHCIRIIKSDVVNTITDKITKDRNVIKVVCDVLTEKAIQESLYPAKSKRRKKEEKLETLFFGIENFLYPRIPERWDARKPTAEELKIIESLNIKHW